MGPGRPANHAKPCVSRSCKIDRIHGKTGGLKASQHKRLQYLYRRRIPPHEIVSREVVRQICAVSREIKRQVGLLVTRKGEVAYVLVGYTNAGKSTLLNALTHSRVEAQNRLFDTLDPSSRRLRFPREREAIITDTVGFIRDLPESLMEAFAATLEELHDADLLLHVVDASSPEMQEQVETVQGVLQRLGLQETPVLLVLNKTDLLGPGEAKRMEKIMGGLAVSAVHPPTLNVLVERIGSAMWSSGPNLRNGSCSRGG